MFVTGVLCTVRGAQVYLLNLCIFERPKYQLIRSGHYHFHLITISTRKFKRVDHNLQVHANVYLVAQVQGAQNMMTSSTESDISHTRTRTKWVCSTPL